MLQSPEVYDELSRSAEAADVRGWAEVSRLLAVPGGGLRFVPDDPDDAMLAAFLDPEAWWRLADLDRHASLAARLPVPADPPEARDPLLRAKLGRPDADALSRLAASARPEDRLAAAGIALFLDPRHAADLAADLTFLELRDLLDRLGAPAGNGDVASGWADAGGGDFPDLGLKGAAKRRPAAVAAALLADRPEPVAALIRAWARRADFAGGYAAGFLAAGGSPVHAAGFVTAGFSGAAPIAARDVASLLLREPETGFAAGRRGLDEAGLEVALTAYIDFPEEGAALLAGTGDPAAAPRLRELYATVPDLSPRHERLYTGILGRPLDRL
jgi:hypothetical protein